MGPKKGRDINQMGMTGKEGSLTNQASDQLAQ